MTAELEKEYWKRCTSLGLKPREKGSVGVERRFSKVLDMTPQHTKGWLMSLKYSEESSWGSPEGLYEDIETEGSKDTFDFDSEVWGKVYRKGNLPRAGDGIAFYHSQKAYFPSPDPYKRRPRISLIGEILDIQLDGNNVKWLKARIRRSDLDSLREKPIVRDETSEHLFSECRIVQGLVATFYEAPPEIWSQFLQEVRGSPIQVSEPSMVDKATSEISEGDLEAISAGFGDAQKNKQVERAAVSFVKDVFKRDGWEVESVEAYKCGYDLLCVKGREEKHVEVKGVSGTRVAFVITEQELNQAKEDKDFCLCVVTAALSQEPMLDQWDGFQVMKAFSFRPLQYVAKLLE